jgi:hypothetical protein
MMMCKENMTNGGFRPVRQAGDERVLMWLSDCRRRGQKTLWPKAIDLHSTAFKKNIQPPGKMVEFPDFIEFLWSLSFGQRNY